MQKRKLLISLPTIHLALTLLWYLLFWQSYRSFLQNWRLHIWIYIITFIISIMGYIPLFQNIKSLLKSRPKIKTYKKISAILITTLIIFGQIYFLNISIKDLTNGEVNYKGNYKIIPKRWSKRGFYFIKTNNQKIHVTLKTYLELKEKKPQEIKIKYLPNSKFSTEIIY